MKNINEYLEKLSSSQNEEDIIENLKRIIRAFNISVYRDIIMSNSYFKSLMIDIKSDVESDMLYMLLSIEKEIINIDNDIYNNKDSELIKLRNECEFLYNELNNRILDLRSLI